MQDRRRETLKLALITQFFVFVFALGMIAQKFAGQQQFPSVLFIVSFGAVLFFNFVYAIAWQQILKRLPLAEAYSHRSMTVLWSLLFGYLLFQESITIPLLLGSVLIIIGVYLVQTDGIHHPTQEPTNSQHSNPHQSTPLNTQKPPTEEASSNSNSKTD